MTKQREIQKPTSTGIEAGLVQNQDGLLQENYITENQESNIACLNPEHTPEGFLHRLFDGQEGYLELRYLPKGAHPESIFLDLADSSTVDKALSWAARRKEDVYFGVYPRSIKDGKDKAVVPKVDMLIADIDSEKVWSLPEGFMKPTFIIASGGGPHKVHCYWTLTEPISSNLASRITEGIAKTIGGDPAVKNKSRVLRLPGTINSKTGNMCQVIECDLMAIYPPEAFEEFEQEVWESDDVFEQIVNMLVPFYNKGQRHSFSISLSGLLCKNNWPFPMAKKLLAELAQKANDDDLGDRLRALEDTYKKHQAGKAIEGAKWFKGNLPASKLEELEELVRLAIFPPEMLRIDAIRLRKGRAFLRMRNISYEIIDYLWENGSFLRCDTGELLWYDRGARNVIPIESDAMQALLEKTFGLNATEQEAKHTIKALISEAIINGDLTTIHRTAFWNRKSQTLYIDAGNGWVYRLDGDKIERIGNGDDGVFFMSEAWQDSFEADFENPADPATFLVGDLSFETGEGVSLTPDQQQLCLYTHYRTMFFPEEQPTKPIITLVGEPGSGKTTTLRRFLVLLYGEKANVSEVGREDAFDAAVTSTHFLVLDNVDNRVGWLPDKLNRVATGEQIVKRKLYHTNEKETYIPKCFIGMSSIFPPFSESSVADRMIILRMARRTRNQPEGKLLESILKNRNRILGGLLLQLNKDVRALKESEAPEVTFRMADWAGIALRIEPEAVNILNGLRNEQSIVVLNNSSLPGILKIWLESDRPNSAISARKWEWLTITQLFVELKPIADSLGEVFFRTPRGLAQHLRCIWSFLEQMFSCQRTNKGKEGYIYKFEGILQTDTENLSNASIKAKGKQRKPRTAQNRRLPDPHSVRISSEVQNLAPSKN
jgi:hypothetical protein